MPNALIVVGLGHGDEGKGSVVDHLVRKHRIRQVVRFNGGAQALHHVVCGGRVHGFSQFGAGTFAGARTVLSRFVLFEPLAFCREAHVLATLGIPDPFTRVTVSARAPVITPLNVLTNRILEIHRDQGRHGSCGMGIGLTQGDVETLGEAALYAGDLADPLALREKLRLIRRRRLEEVGGIEGEATRELKAQLAAFDLEDLAQFYGEFAGQMRVASEEQVLELIAGEDTVFEGAQGVLLDQRWGFFPHVTRSTTTFENAETLLHEAGCRGWRVRIGLLRGYGTRHGAGPFPTESAELAVEPCHNRTNDWQGAFRTGWFDAVAARYALDAAGGVDLLGLTNLDRLAGHEELKAAVQYRPGSLFPDGLIPQAPPDLEMLRKGTRALALAQPEYAPLPPIRHHNPAGLFRYADAIGELLGQYVELISARADYRKFYREDVPW